MTPSQELTYILPECFLAVGQAVGTDKGLDFDAVVWWHERYRAAFLHAMTAKGNSWSADRRRVTAVGRYLGLQAKAHADVAGRASIDVESATKASIDIERGCQMSAKREAFSGTEARQETTG